MTSAGSLYTSKCLPVRDDYDEAFREWSRKTSFLQSRIADPDASVASVQHAREEAELAQSLYRQRRDRLAECLQAASGTCIPCTVRQ